MATVSSCVQAPGMQSVEVPREYPKKIVIRSQSRIFLQTVADIDYLSAAANYVHIHSAGQVFRIRSTINAIEQRLDPQKFGRVHRCTIVNFERVKESHALQRGDYLLVLQDGSQLKMSRRHRSKLEKLLPVASHGKTLVKYGSDSKENGFAAAASVGGRAATFARN
jgi:two-component system, LytTR family, response regulator